MSVQIDFAGQHQSGTQIMECIHGIEAKILFDIQRIMQRNGIQHLHIRRTVLFGNLETLQRGEAIFQFQLQCILKITIPLIA